MEDPILFFAALTDRSERCDRHPLHPQHHPGLRRSLTDAEVQRLPRGETD